MEALIGMEMDRWVITTTGMWNCITLQLSLLTLEDGI